MDEQQASADAPYGDIVPDSSGGFVQWLRRALGTLPDSPPTARFSISCWLFLRGLGLTYLAALVSLWVQIDGLVGSRGILPAAELYATVRERFGTGGFLLAPGLAWFSASDAMLHGLCAVGVVAAVLLTVDVLPALAAGVLWVCHLSLSSAGGRFLEFQWDTLLLETGLLGIFLAPLSMRPRHPARWQPDVLARLLLAGVLFRLMFQSGVTKLLSGDPTWRDLTALDYHFETQPLPTWIGWWAHQLPGWFLKGSTAFMYFVEIVAPFFVFGPRVWRLVAFGLLVTLQLLIAATGNYGFFNLLALLLCVPLLDDGVFPQRWRGAAPPLPRRWPRAVVAAMAMVTLYPTTLMMAANLGVAAAEFGVLWRPVEWFQPLRSTNSYGLFRVMTTERCEIEIEGSADGETWKPYDFKFKPGPPDRAPGFMAPHMPRVDWQMWFAALGTYRNNPWFVSFCRRLLENSPPVTALLRSNPFPEAPPKLVRATRILYHFTNREGRRRDGAWWTREPAGVYLPEISLENFRRER